MELKYLETYMHEAIAIAKKGNTPFGALVVDAHGNKVGAFNTTKTHGPTAHAEMNVLQKIGALKYESANELVLYTTVEPCPMCMGGILWAGIGKIVYGTSIKEVSKRIKQIKIDCKTVATKSWYTPIIISDVLEKDCLTLFDNWP